MFCNKCVDVNQAIHTACCTFFGNIWSASTQRMLRFSHARQHASPMELDVTPWFDRGFYKEATRRLALKVPRLFSPDDVRVSPVQQSIVDDCVRVALRWLASQLTLDKAKAVLRVLFNLQCEQSLSFDFSRPFRGGRKLCWHSYKCDKMLYDIGQLYIWSSCHAMVATVIILAVVATFYQWRQAKKKG